VKRIVGIDGMLWDQAESALFFGLIPTIPSIRFAKDRPTAHARDESEPRRRTVSPPVVIFRHSGDIQ
jgi:hypothetical protein